MPPIDPLRCLLDAANEGDNVAVAELVRLTQQRVYRLCSALGSAGEEDDLVQETYLRALKSLSTYRGEALVHVWLLSIARRVCADHVRRRLRQQRLIDKLTLYTADRHESPYEISPDLLATLDPDRREAFVLTQLVGLSYEEAAGVIGCPIGTIRSRVAPCTQRFAHCAPTSERVVPRTTGVLVVVHVGLELIAAPRRLP